MMVFVWYVFLYRHDVLTHLFTHLRFWVTLRSICYSYTNKTRLNPALAITSSLFLVITEEKGKLTYIIFMYSLTNLCLFVYITHFE